MVETKNTVFNLEGLTDRQKIVFKREAGKSLTDSVSVLGEFYRIKPPFVKQYEEQIYFAVLCLACKYEDSDKQIKPLEQIIRSAREAGIKSGEASDGTSSMDRRIDKLMSSSIADGTNLFLHKLTRIITLCDRNTKGVWQIDFDSLYRDLIHWDSDSKFVQRKWASAIYGDQQ